MKQNTGTTYICHECKSVKYPCALTGFKGTIQPDRCHDSKGKVEAKWKPATARDLFKILKDSLKEMT